MTRIFEYAQPALCEKFNEKETVSTKLQELTKERHVLLRELRSGAIILD